MSNTAIIELVGACAGVLGLAAFMGLVAAPAWQSYSRTWERLAATFLSLYVLVALVGIGFVAGVEIIRFWDRLTS